MVNRYDCTVFFIEQPLNLPCFTVYSVKENEVIDVLSGIKFKTSIDFLTS